MSRQKPIRSALAKAIAFVRRQQWLKHQVRGLLVQHASGGYSRLQKLRRAKDPIRTLSTLWEAPTDMNAPSNLHSVLADQTLLTLERPERLNAEFIRDSAPPGSEVLEHVVDVYQMRQSAASVCFIVPILRNDPEALERTLQSVLRQTDPDWELLLSSGEDLAAGLGRWLEIDWRVRRFTSATQINDAQYLKQAAIQATTSFIGLLSHGDVVDADLVKSIGAKVRVAPTTDMVFLDGGQRAPNYSLEHKHSINVPCRFVGVRKSLLLSVPATHGGSPAATDCELIQALTQRARRVSHIGALDVHAAPGVSSGFTADELTKAMLFDALPVDVAAVDSASPAAYQALIGRLTRIAKDEAVRLKLDWDALMIRAPEQHSAARQALTLLQRGLFDSNWYRATYPDVSRADFEPIVHYVNLGDAEGRRPNAYFDPVFYRSQFGTTSVRSVTALYHYALIGEALGLKASGAFDPRGYMVSNVDLQPWVDQPLMHFLHLGREGGLMTRQRARLSDTGKIRFGENTSPTRLATLDARAGINVIGPLDRVSGLGVSARGYLEGLQRAEITNIGCRVQQREFSVQKDIGNSRSFPPYLPHASVNLVHMNGDALAAMIKQEGEEFLQDRYNIAVWYWELPTLRPEWQTAMSYFHEFWAPTPFIARCLRQSTAKPVSVVPPYLGYLENLLSKAQVATGPSHFIYCFDANSVLERKNPGALLDAFVRAFPSLNDEAKLTFKVTYSDRRNENVERLYQAANKDPRIRVLDNFMSDAELHALIGSATAYVSPHRSEGLGLTILEAMASNVPVIATAFGGPDYLLTSDTAYPISFQHVELDDENSFPYVKGYVWANPDIDHLASLLKLAHIQRNKSSERTALAREQVKKSFFSPELRKTYRSALSRVS